MKKIFLFVKNGGNETLVGRYDSKADAQEKVMDMVEEDSVSVFNFRIEEREYEDITNRVKSYADACKVLGIEPMDEDSMKAQGFRPDEIARRQLETITEALNEGWKPNWTDTDEYKFYPWFYIEVSEVQTEGAFRRACRAFVRGYGFARLRLRLRTSALGFASTTAKRHATPGVHLPTFTHKF